MTWNDAMTWFGSDIGKNVADWLVALGTTGAVLFAILSTVYERKRRLLSRDTDLERAFNLAVERREEVANQINFRIKASRLRPALLGRLSPPSMRWQTVVVRNPAIVPVYRVALIQRPHSSGEPDKRYELYVTDPIWYSPVISAGCAIEFEARAKTLGDLSSLLLRFETPNASAWVKTEDGHQQLISDSSLLGVHSEKAIARHLRDARNYEKKRKKGPHLTQNLET